MTLPNKLSFVRIFLVPILVTLLLTNSHFSMPLALIIFLLAALTDFLDGYIARKSKQITTLGKFLDPMADKLLICSALISLVQISRASAWIVVIIVCREIAITGLRSVAASQGVIIAAGKMGKFKTVTEIFAVSFLILNKQPFGEIFLWTAMLLAISSGVEYVVKFNKKIKLNY